MMLAVVFTPQPSFARYASIVVNETTGEVVYSRSADKQLYPASLTKVMTLYLMFEALDAGDTTMDTKMKVSRVAAGRSPSKLGLKAGSSLSVKDAILSLVTKSANDAATVISEHLAPSERDFAKKMTRKAKALGMSRTTFKNASGLPHSQQKSTARDMARLAVAIRKDFPQYFHYFKTKQFSFRGKRYKNHNRLLTQFKGTDGIKTGYIRASGFNLIATAERGGVRMVGVVFGGRTGASRNKHMIFLLDKQFSKLPTFDAPAPILRQAKIAAPSPPKTPPKKPRAVLVFAAKSAPSIKSSGARLDTSTDLPQLNDPVVRRPVQTSDWGIQVGSFSRRANAHIAARNARHSAEDILSRLPAKLRPVTYGSVTFWQVHFQGFNEDRAREACAELLQSGMACIALPSSQI